MVKLSDKLLEVCNKHVEVAKGYSMDKLCRGLTRLTSSRFVLCGKLGSSRLVMTILLFLLVTSAALWCPCNRHWQWPFQ